MVERVNLLSLDGGGIRGVSELLILNEIMKRIKYDKNLDYLPRPCDFFHIIGGTSTGGLIAIMLGRLRMTTEEALQQYRLLASRIFSKENRKNWLNSEYKASTLEECIKTLVEEKSSKGNTMLGDGQGRVTGNTFVCATPARNFSHPRLFRSYEVRENATDDCYIWEAARATTAAPRFFKSIAIGKEGAKEEFIDAALGWNNPTKQVCLEARSVYGDHASLGCLVSIGTGLKKEIGIGHADRLQKLIPTDLLKAVVQMATNCEEVAGEYRKRFAKTPGHYFRFNVQRGADDIGLAEWEKTSDLESHTKAYLEDISEDINILVKQLCKRLDTREVQDKEARSGISLQELCGMLPANTVEPPSYSSTMSNRPAPTALFTGRSDVLNKMEDCFRIRINTVGKRRECLLYGMGGAGKTQIALRFAENNQNRFRYIFYVDASTRETVVRGYKDIARHIDPSFDFKCNAEDAIKALEYFTEDWLMIFDGADEVDMLEGLWPPGLRGNVVYTSRNHLLRRLDPNVVFHIDRMSDDEAIRLLLRSAQLQQGTVHYSEAGLIVKDLGNLPLAVDQAGAYIANGTSSIGSFREDFRRYHRDLLRSKAYSTASDQSRAVFATWDLSYKAISRLSESNNNDSSGGKADHAKAALQILDIFAFFHHENIPEQIFANAAENPELHYQYETGLDPDLELRRGGHAPMELLTTDSAGKWDHKRFRAGIQVLLSYSLISRSVTDYHYSLHALVHDWNADRVEQKRDSSYAYAAGDVLTACTTTRRMRDAEYNDFHRALVAHYDAWCKSIKVYPSHSFVAHYPEIGSLYLSMGQWAKAEVLTLQLSKVSDRVLGTKHIQSLRCKINLTEIYLHQGRIKQADAIQDGIVEPLREKNLSCNADSGLWQALDNLATIHRWQSKGLEALALYQELIEMSAKSHGPASIETLQMRLARADMYSDLSRFKDAKREILDVRSTCLASHGQSDLLIKCDASMVKLFMARKRPWFAVPVQKRIIAWRTETLGEDHNVTIQAMSNLAAMYELAALPKKAVALGHQMLDSQLRILGPDHPNTTITRSYLARALKVSGHRGAAIATMQEVAGRYADFYGPGHTYTLQAKALLNDWQHPWRNLETVNQEFLEVMIRRGNVAARISYTKYRNQV